MMSPRGPRPREDLPAPPVRPPTRQDSRGSNRSERSDRQRSRSSSNPLENLFKRRYREKSYSESPPSRPPVIPDIVVESPVSARYAVADRRKAHCSVFQSTTASGNRSSMGTTAHTHPELLSPELAAQPLAPSAPQDPPIIVMRTEIPGYYPPIPVDQDFVPPRPESASQGPVIPA